MDTGVKSKIRTCLVCFFYVEWERDSPVSIGHCHRYPPTADSGQSTYPFMRNYPVERFPLVPGDLYCGEWKSKGEKTE